MAIRVKRHWFKEGGERKPEELATVVAATIWKVSMHGLQSVRKADFAVDVGAPYMAALAEFVVFLAAVADRIAYRHDPGDWRQAFTVAMAKRLAEIHEENLDQLAGRDDRHKRRFIDLLNTRMAEYADFEYGDQGPDFGFQRYFGSCVEAAIVDPDDRRWILDQIMTVQAPEAVEVIERSLRGLLGIDPKPSKRAGSGGE